MNTYYYDDEANYLTPDQFWKDWPSIIAYFKNFDFQSVLLDGFFETAKFVFFIAKGNCIPKVENYNRYEVWLS
jgi:hypothetical protein